MTHMDTYQQKRPAFSWMDVEAGAGRQVCQEQARLYFENKKQENSKNKEFHSMPITGKLAQNGNMGRTDKNQQETRVRIVPHLTAFLQPARAKFLSNNLAIILHDRRAQHGVSCRHATFINSFQFRPHQVPRILI